LKVVEIQCEVCKFMSKVDSPMNLNYHRLLAQARATKRILDVYDAFNLIASIGAMISEDISMPNF
jgi:hypothetical protein